MILGLFFAIVAGLMVSLQSIFNSKVNEQIGTWTTTAIVLGLGALASFTIGLFLEGKHLFILENMKVWYWFSGIIGIGVVSCLVQSIRLLGPTFATSITLSSQLGFALILDSLGWFGLHKVPFTFKDLIGVFIIIAGILVFKLSDLNTREKLQKVQ
ncbi:DMT family transporter [Neobacillus sp. D3-1R]|uniref:DMT family transporter n=1 Tax=Neobacillus sp. D3-1R TaxID=3445778 RepID=UPI003F9F7BCA